MNHAPLAPSSAFQWRWCAGSVSLSQGIGDEDTDASREGTAAHWVCEQILQSYITPDASIKLNIDLVGSLAPNGVSIDEEMYDAALTYTQEIIGVCNQSGLLSQLHIEQRVTMPEIHEHCWGTPDCWSFDTANSTLYIWDFKYGHGSVLAYENWQLICYAIGILREITNGQPLGEHGIEVVFRIVQPRCYDGQGPLREWVIPCGSDLRGHVNQLRVAAEDVFNGSATCITGDWCKNCDGAIHCYALTQSVASIIDRSSDATPLESSDAGLVYELDKIDHAILLIKQRKAALETDAEQRIRNGGRLQGLALEQGYGNNKWINPPAEVAAMGELLGVELWKERELITPAKAIQAFKKIDVDAAVISSYYHRPLTKMKLVRDDGEAAKQIFSKGKI